MTPTGGVTPVSRRVMNLSYFLRRAARRQGDRVGLVWGERQWTWHEIDRRVDAFAAVLADHGVRKGARVLVQSKNCNQMFESMFACFRLGAVWVPTNFRQTAAEVADLARAAGATTMICHRDFPEHARAVGAATTLAIGPCDFAEDCDGLIERQIASVGPRAGEGPTASVDYDDPCWFFFTSGTTGRPKAAVLTHGQMAFVVTNHLCDLMPGTGENDASLVVASLSHGAGIHQLVQTAAGAKTVLPAGERLDPGEAWALVERWRITNLFTVPTILKTLVEHPSVDAHDHGSLRHVIYAGAPMYRADQKRALAKLGPVLVQYFGLGEVTGAITVLPPGLHDAGDGPEARIGTCGLERTGMQVSIQDADGAELAAGATGEICVCGPAVFAGYYDNPKANADAFRDGWFRTGDLGHRDAEGFVYITGRRSDMFISGGSNVHPREIEEKILQHEAVAEVAVLGVPDPHWGEVGVAVCVLRDGTSMEEGELAAWLGDRIARYKVPRRIFFWSALPKSAYGKITKKDIRAELEARGGPTLARDGSRG